MLLLFLLLISSQAEEDLSDQLLPGLASSQRRLSASGTGLEPENGLLVFIYSNKYRWTRLAHWSGGCGFYDGSVNQDQLWELKEDTPGRYFLINNTHGDRYATHSNGNAFCYNGSYSNDQRWTFERYGMDKFVIKNVAHPRCHLALWGTTSGGVYCGRVYNDAYFRLVSPFTSTASWAIVHEFNNGSGQAVPHAYSYKKGMTRSFSETTARSTKSSTSLTLAARTSLGRARLSATWTTSFESTYSHSITQARQSHFLEEVSMNYTVPPNTKLCLQQLQITTTDSSTNKSFVYESPRHELVPC